MKINGNTFRQIRKKKQVTLIELEQALSIPSNHFYKWERGKGEVPKNVVKELANYLEVPEFILTSEKDYSKSSILLSDEQQKQKEVELYQQLMKSFEQMKAEEERTSLW